METRKQLVDKHILMFAQEYINKHWGIASDDPDAYYITCYDLEYIINYVYDKTPYKRNRIKQAIKRKFKVYPENFY